MNVEIDYEYLTSREMWKFRNQYIVERNKTYLGKERKEEAKTQ